MKSWNFYCFTVLNFCPFSLLPYSMHIDVAESCIKYGRNMVTASYVSPAMRDLHKEWVLTE